MFHTDTLLQLCPARSLFEILNHPKTPASVKQVQIHQQTAIFQDGLSSP